MTSCTVGELHTYMSNKGSVLLDILLHFSHKIILGTPLVTGSSDEEGVVPKKMGKCSSRKNKTSEM